MKVSAIIAASAVMVTAPARIGVRTGVLVDVEAWTRFELAVAPCREAALPTWLPRHC